MGIYRNFGKIPEIGPSWCHFWQVILLTRFRNISPNWQQTWQCILTARDLTYYKINSKYNKWRIVIWWNLHNSDAIKTSFFSGQCQRQLSVKNQINIGNQLICKYFQVWDWLLIPNWLKLKFASMRSANNSKLSKIECLYRILYCLLVTLPLDLMIRGMCHMIRPTKLKALQTFSKEFFTFQEHIILCIFLCSDCSSCLQKHSAGKNDVH